MAPLELLPAQDRFLFAKEKYTGLIGGLGSGKTRGGAAKAIQALMAGKPGMVVAPTFPMLRDSPLQTVLIPFNLGS